MPLVTRVDPADQQIDVKHPDYEDGWVPLVGVLQLAGGLNTRMVQEQAELLTTIAQKIHQLESIVSNTLDSKTNIVAIKALLQTIQTDLAANSTAVGEASDNVNLIYALVQQLVTATNSNTSAGQNTLQGVTAVRTQLDDVKNLLASIPQIRDAVKDTQAENIFTTTVNITGANQEFSCALPDKTKGLSFFGRKDAFGKSPADLRYAFIPGQVATGGATNFQTIYRYGVFDRSNLLWSGKTLYLASPKTMVVEVQAIY